MSQRTAKNSAVRTNGKAAIEPEAGMQDHPDFRSLIACLKVFCGSIIVAGVVYWLTGDKTIAAGICGTVVVLLTLWHTPFGLFILLTLLALENAIVLSPSFTVSKVMGIVILISFVLRLISRKLVFPLAIKLIFLVGLWSCLSWLWSLDPESSGIILTTYILYIGFCPIFVNTIRDYKSLQVLLAGFIIGALITSCMLMLGQVAYETSSSERMGRAALAEGGSVIVLGRAITLGFLSACLVFFSRNKFLKKIIAAILFLFFVVLVTKTQSRAPLIASIIAPVLSILLCTQSKQRLKTFFLGAFILFIAFVSLKLVLKTDLMNIEAKERFAGMGLEESGRIGLWKQALGAFKKRPLHGYGLANSNLSLEENKGVSPHNTFIAILVDLGLVGFILYAAIFLLLYRGVMKIQDFRFKWLGMTMLLFPLITGLTSVIYLKKDFWYAIMIALVCIAIDAREKPNLSAGI